MVAGSLGKTRIQSTTEPEVGFFPLVSYHSPTLGKTWKWAVMQTVFHMASFSSRLGQEKGGSNDRGPTGTLKYEQEKSSSLNPRSCGFNRVGQTPLLTLPPLQLGPGMWAQS